MEEEQGFSGVMPMSNMQAHPTSLQYQLENEEIIDEIINSIRCRLRKIVDGQIKWVDTPFTVPLINERGISGIKSILTSRLSKVFILSDLSEEQIINFTLSVSSTLTVDFFKNWKEYEIRDLAAARQVTDTVCQALYSTYRKSFNGTYLRFLTKTHSVSEIQQNTLTNKNEGSDRKGLFDKLLRRK